ncbi:MAG TPA: nitrile hydratase subunit alpha [Candidatus Dormibacteraeota bacterium]
MSDHHDHDDHAHHGDLTEIEARVLALESLLLERGLIEPGEVDDIVYKYEHDVGPMLGAKVVARAWLDADFKRRLLEDGSAAIRELGVESHDLELVVVENSPNVHHLVVCTLCSCYPWFLVGLPPVWYKSAPYRSRAVLEPRTVLAEFGLDLPTDSAVHVHDSTAELRYLVLPEQPAGTEGWSEDELAALVTRDSMIGVALARTPEMVS